MQTSTTREKLHQYIDMIEEEKIEAVYSLLADDIDTDTLRKNLILEERAKYLRGEGKSFTWEEVKEMAANKKQRSGL